LSEELNKFEIDSAEIVIRLISPVDSISEITMLLHRSYKKLADLGFRYLATHQKDDETQRRLNKGKSYIALSKERIISTITLYMNDTEAHNADWYKKEGVAHFGQFGVLPEYQNKGIGSYMMDILEARAKKEGAVEIALDTAEGAAHLINYYKKRGYRYIEYVNWEVTNYRSVIMSKKL
jgi:GNAT superfamily N-acetyltransferase